MWIYFVLAGLFSGIIGGMGMGGGTLLIPMLTMFLSVSQHTAQGVNLVVFVLTGIVAAIVHMRNHLIDFKMILWLIIPAISSTIFASLWSNSLDGKILKTIFGVFLIIIATYELVVAIYKTTKIKKPILKNKL